MDAAVRLELPAQPRSVSKARHAVSQVAARLGCDVEAVATAVSELVGNCVSHAYVGDERGPERSPVIVLARPMGGGLVVTVADLGHGFKPRLDSPGVGLGLPMVNALANEVRIDSDDRGATVSVGFDCDDAGGNASAPGSRVRAADLGRELERARELLLRVGSAD